MINKFLNKKKNLKNFQDFYKIYKKRPIKNNKNGIKIEHAFYLYLVIKKLKPEIIIESGVFAGQSTWLIEKFSKNSEIYCFDINLSNLKYKSKKAIYFEKDLNEHNWSKIDKNKTLIFFDDHVNFYERLVFSKKNKFKHLLFDDNYPSNIGDCYSFKKILSESDNIYYQYEYFENKILAKLKFYIKNIIGIKKFYGHRRVKFLKNKIQVYDYLRYVKFNNKHKIIFNNYKKTYYEFPPLVKFDAIKRWKKYQNIQTNFLKKIKTKKPIFNNLTLKKIIEKKDLTELSDQYNFFCYYKVK
jgi:hypothetical protein